MNNQQPNLIFRIARTFVYVGLIYARSIGGVFYESMDSLIKEVEVDAEMKRRATVLKRHKPRF